MERLVSFFGLFVMIGLAWLMSSHKRRVPWRVVGGGLALQFSFALLILKTPAVRKTFDSLGGFFNQLLGFVNEGTSLLFNINPSPDIQNLPPGQTLLQTFAFGVLPTIIFFSALMSILYHLGLMQLVVGAMSWVMRRTLGTSGAETLSAAANVFVGQTEAPLVIRPYVSKMTQSELMVVMVGGFATIAGGVFAIYVSLGADAGHLLTASVISAPASLLIAKVLQPEIEDSQTAGSAAVVKAKQASNLLEAAAEGVTAGLQLALNVGAMLIAFTALVAMINAALGGVGGWLGFTEEQAWSLQALFGYAFAPLAWLMGIPWKDCLPAGQMLGVKMVLNEFFAYFALGEAIKTESISPRSITILTYALCGFANFSSIGIQLGGIGSIAPERRSDLAKLGLRAMLGGTLAAFMTACIAGMLL